MKIAILSDIHGNSIALKAVLEGFRKENIEEIFCLGDFVGYYYRSDEVWTSLESWPKEVIGGNHEQMLKDSLASDSKSREIRERYGSGIQQSLKKLKPEVIEMFIKLPSRKRVIRDGVRFELCHGSPWDRDFYVYPDASSEILDRCYIEDTDFVLMGHTHRPFLKKIKECSLVNPGSVGQARDKGSQASWAIIDTDAKDVKFMSTPYNPEALIKEAQAFDPDLGYLQQVLVRNT